MLKFWNIFILISLILQSPPESDWEETTGLLNEQNSAAQIRTHSTYFSRWQSFSGICLFISVAGTTYAFSVYSQLLRSRLGYSEDALDFIASIGNNG